jgi:hypothetical protein
MTISARNASTAFDRFNFTIIDTFDFSDPVPTNYVAEDFFTFYDIIFAINPNQAGWQATTQYLFLLGVQTYLEITTQTQNGTGSDDRLSRLQEFLATPLLLFNNGNFDLPTGPMGTSASLAIPSYRVYPPFVLL